jgi:RimJ/RimL family protein N-acetyltransferase
MDSVEPSLHPWYSYWLIVVKEIEIGAGLVGFKGAPDLLGEAEIGYGIAPRFRDQGFMTEAVRALIAWAFDHPACQAIIADPNQDNIASQRVLAKAGMTLVEQTKEAQLWRIEKESWAKEKVAGGKA